MAALSHKTRVEMEQMIHTFFEKIDPTHTNTKFYDSFFSKMNDKEFDKFFEDFFADKDAYLTLTVNTFENDVKMENLENCGKYMNIPFYEYVVCPYFSNDPKNPIVTPFPVPVGYMHEKRVQQTAIKKNSTSIDINQRDAKTGQVINHDKNGRESIEENYAMMTYGAVKATKEFMSFRADDMVMKEEAYANIRHNGYVAMDELTDNVENKTSLNMFDTYMICMGLKTDLVTPGMLLTKTLK